MAVSVHDLQWLFNAWLAQVPVQLTVHASQFLLQGEHIHILIIVEMAEPPEKRTKLVLSSPLCSGQKGVIFK